MNKSMKPSNAARQQMRPLTEEEKKEQFMRAYIQKKASLAEGILFNLCQNPSLLQICEANKKSAVEIANSAAEECMKVIYKQDITIKEDAE